MMLSSTPSAQSLIDIIKHIDFIRFVATQEGLGEAISAIKAEIEKLDAARALVTQEKQEAVDATATLRAERQQHEAAARTAQVQKDEAYAAQKQAATRIAAAEEAEARARGRAAEADDYSKNKIAIADKIHAEAESTYKEAHELLARAIEEKRLYEGKLAALQAAVK